MSKRLLAALLAVCLLGTAAPQSVASSLPAAAPQPCPAAPVLANADPWPDEQALPPGWLDEWPAPEQLDVPDRTAAQRAYGSAGLVAWPSILISVYLDEWNGAKWSEAGIAASRERLGLAVGWIREQCAAYGAAPRIWYDDGTPDSGLFYHQTYDGRFAGGEDSDESDDYYTAVEELCAELDTDALHERYGTSSVGFLFFLPVSGVSFTIVHYLEDANAYYHEYCTLYRYDAYSDAGTEESPAVYAHEILHLFGAADLYEGSADEYVTDSLSRYVERHWPGALMLDTYQANGGIRYDAVGKTLCPLTAYRLGLLTQLDELADWPDIGALPPGTFAADLRSARYYPYDSGAVAA